MVSALKKKVLNYIVYVTNIGFPARLNKQKIKWKHLQKVIPVWNIAITFHSNQNHCLLSILRPVVGKTAGWKLKANLWKTVVKRCIVYIWTFVKWIMKHPTTSSTLCRMHHLNNKQNKNTNPIINRQDYHLTQPCLSEGKQKQTDNNNNNKKD